MNGERTLKSLNQQCYKNVFIFSLIKKKKKEIGWTYKGLWKTSSCVREEVDTLLIEDRFPIHLIRIVTTKSLLPVPIY